VTVPKNLNNYALTKLVSSTSTFYNVNDPVFAVLTNSISTKFLSNTWFLIGQVSNNIEEHVASIFINVNSSAVTDESLRFLKMKFLIVPLMSKN
jgi:hypothetical protein